MANEVFEVLANGKQLVLLRKPRDYDPSDHDAVVAVPSRVTELDAFEDLTVHCDRFIGRCNT